MSVATARDEAIVRRLDGSAEARRLSALARIDYQDAFELDLGPGARPLTAEGWIREMVEGASAERRSRLVLGWSALGLKLASRDDPRAVLGWGVRRSEPGAVVLGADSRLGMPAELVLLRGPASVTFSTQIRFGNPAVRLLWRAVEPSHLRVVPALLAAAGRRAG